MTAAAAVKAPGGEAMLGRAVAHRPPRSYRDKLRFHNNSYANQTWTSNSGDESRAAAETIEGLQS
jgi:hypothetical protein